MKKTAMNVFSVLLMMFLCLFIVSCSPNETDTSVSAASSEKTMLVLIAGAHSNSEIMNMDSKNEIQDVFSDFGEIRVVVADGKPKIALGENGKYLGKFDEIYINNSRKKKEKNKRRWESDILEIQTNTFISEIKGLEPDDPEVDTLEAFFEAEKVMKSITEDEKNIKKEIIIYDTGVCTSGTIDFTDNDWANLLFYDGELENEKIQSVVDRLKEKDKIPNLTDIQVLWYGIGETAQPQDPFDHHQKENLQKIWSVILDSAGAVPLKEQADYGYFMPVESQGQTCYPQTVKVIPVIHVDDNKSDETDEYDDEKINSTKIDMEKIGFKHDSTDFIYEQHALDYLKPYAASILSHPDEEFLLVGTTSDPKRNGGSISLSNERAEKVKEYLVSLGVPETQIDTLGWGSKDPLYNKKEWMGNIYYENIARENRAVYFFLKNSEDARKLLGEDFYYER